MQLSLIEPSALDSRWIQIPPLERVRVDKWMVAIDMIGGIHKPVSECARKLAALLMLPVKTVRNKIEELIKAGGDWWALVDKRKLTAEITAPKNHTANPDFQKHLKTLIEDNKLSTAQAIEKLKLDWRMREPIPGYDDYSCWPQYPKGWSERNLYRAQPTKDILVNARIGSQAAAKYMPMVRTTRANLYPGAIYYFDDVWHDNYVRVGLQAVTRVLELGVMDAFSACRFHIGAKPRMPKADKKGNQGIKKKEMLWFLVEVLTRYGYSARGTELRAEHGTAAISAVTEAILKRITNGLVTVQRSGIIGKDQPLMAEFWRGKGKGNPRAKGALESIHHLLHNAMGNLPGQTGANRQTAPETVGIPVLNLSNDPAAVARRVQSFLKNGHTLQLVPYQQFLLEAATIMRPEVQALLIHPLMDFHTEFYPAAVEINHQINCRTKHSLEGWPELKFCTIEYFDPEAGTWILPHELSLLPPDRFARVSECARTSPKAFTRPRNLSPFDVWQKREDMIRLSPFEAIEILGAELAVMRTVKGSYIKFKDDDISPVELVYKAELVTPDGGELILRHGQKYLCYCNPYNPDYLMVVDAQFRPLGVAKLDPKVDGGDKEALARAYAEKSHRTAERLQDYRMRHAGEVAAVGALREHNVSTMVHGTAEDRTNTRREAGKKGLRTAAANRLQKRGKPVDWDAVPASTPTAFDPLAGLSDETDLPESF